MEGKWRETLVARRRAAGITVMALAERLRLPVSTMRQLESGDCIPNGDLRAEWAEALDDIGLEQGRGRLPRSLRNFLHTLPRAARRYPN